MLRSDHGLKIVKKVRKAKVDFGTNYPKKYGGAAAIEILRDELNKSDIKTSKRDVFIKNIPLEIDLVIPTRNAKPYLGLLYEPDEVIVALEIKKLGAFGESGRNKIRNDFRQLKKKGVNCVYVSIEERKDYKWRPTKKTLGFPCFTLAWHKTTNEILIPTKEGWEALIRFIQKEINSHK